MPTYDYKCRECGEVFEVLRHFSELDKEVKCPNCGSLKTERIFSAISIQGETVTGAKFGPDVPQSSPGRGMGRGLGRGPRDGRGMGRGRRRS